MSNKNTNWFILGDIHADVSPIEWFYEKNNERLKLDDSLNNIILLGDVGCNYFASEKDEITKEEMSKLPFTYICLRGNHESRVKDVADVNLGKWDVMSKYGGNIYVEKKFPNIEYLEDGPAIYDFAGYKTLSIPGAYSVDKWYRLRMNWKWYDNEQLSDEEMNYGRELIARNPVMDLVISHTCPYSFEPTDLFLSNIDQSAVDKTMELYLDEIERSVNYKRWAWGHYHENRLYPWDGDKEKIMLINDKMIDLHKFMNMKKTDYFYEIMA